MPPADQRTLDQVTFLTAHNAYANGVDGGFAPPFVNFFPNQSRGIAQQLDNGVRGFMMDIHQTPDGAILCHDSCTLVSRPVALWVDVQLPAVGGRPAQRLHRGAVAMGRTLVRSPLAAVAAALATLLGLLTPVAAAAPAQAPTAATAAAPTPLAASWTAPLSTRGRWIVDADGNRFKLKSGNWHGASGTRNGSGDAADPVNHHAGEDSGRMPLGRDRAPIADILAGFAELGINTSGCRSPTR